jgi:hypothetical protein
VGLSDQTLGFFLELDSSPWDKTVKHVGADYKKFVDTLDKATTKLAKKPQAALNDLANTIGRLSGRVQDVAKMVSAMDRDLAKGRPVRIPVEFVVNGRGAGAFKQAIAEAVAMALGGSKMTLVPQVPRRPVTGFKPGTTRQTYKGLPTPAAYEAGFITQFGTARPVRRRAAGTPNLRSALAYGSDVSGIDQMAIAANRGELLLTKAQLQDVVEAAVRQGAQARFGYVSQGAQVGAMRLRTHAPTLAGMQSHLEALKSYETLSERRGSGEKISNAEMAKARKEIERSVEGLEKIILTVKDPLTKLALQHTVSVAKDELADLRSNAQLDGTMFDPRYWNSLSRNSSTFVSGLTNWLAHHPIGRIGLGAGAIGYAGLSLYRKSGGYDAAMAAHGMGGSMIRYQPGTTRDEALAYSSRMLGQTGSVLTRAEMMQGGAAAMAAGLRPEGMEQAAAYLGYAERGFGLDAGQGAQLLGENMNRFGRTLDAATRSIGLFAGEAKATRISISQLGGVAQEAADSASEADYRRGTGGLRMEKGVQGFAALTRSFGGGEAGARLAKPVSDLALRLQQGDLSAITGGALLFGGRGAMDAMMGRGGSTDLMKNLNVDFLKRLQGQPPVVLNQMAQVMGLPYPTLAALVGKAANGQPITDADFTRVPRISAKQAADQTVSWTEGMRNAAAAGVDRLTGLSPATAINIAHGSGILGEIGSMSKDLLIWYGGTKLLGGGFGDFGGTRIGRGARAVGRGLRWAGRGIMGAAPGIGGINAYTGAPIVSRGSGVLGVLGRAGGVGSRVAARLGGIGLSGVGLGGGALGVGTALGLAGLSTGLAAGTIANARAITGFGDRMSGYASKHGTEALAALGVGEDTWGNVFRDKTSLFRDSYKTDVNTMKEFVAGKLGEAGAARFRAIAEAAGQDPTVFLRENQDKISASVAEARSKLEGATSTREVAAIARNLADAAVKEYTDSLTEPMDRAAEYLRQILDVLRLRGE